jgi:transposase-like protein
MGQLLHGSAKTTYAVRSELQRSEASIAKLAKRYGINEKTVIKWRSYKSVEDRPMGPKEPHSTVLSPMEGVAIPDQVRDGVAGPGPLACRSMTSLSRSRTSSRT